MVIGKGKVVGLVLGTIVVPAVVAGSVFAAVNKSIKLSKADTFSVVLNNSLQPTLDNTGAGTLLDNKGVTWEYYHAEDYASGHVSLDNGGYFGVSASSAFGYTHISNIEIEFSAGSDGELWLLQSIDGTTWCEAELLKASDDDSSTSASSVLANDWRYVRFFFDYDTNNDSIDIDSVTIQYACYGESASEDVDCAHVENVIQKSDTLTYDEATVFSPLTSDSSRAITFTKSGTGATNMIIGFGKTYTVGQIQHKKVEFDIKGNVNYGKTMQLMKDTTGVTSSIDSSKHSAYKCTNISDDWYHIEVPVSTLISTISGYDTQDIPAKNVESKEINAVKINAGGCTIDNLKLTTIPCASGFYNNGTSFNSGSVYWVKASWVGILRGCTMSFDVPIAEQVTSADPKLKNGSPFYIKGLSSGTVVVTLNITCGYDKRVVTLSNTITIN